VPTKCPRSDRQGSGQVLGTSVSRDVPKVFQHPRETPIVSPYIVHRAQALPQVRRQDFEGGQDSSNRGDDFSGFRGSGVRIPSAPQKRRTGREHTLSSRSSFLGGVPVGSARELAAMAANGEQLLTGIRRDGRALVGSLQMFPFPVEVA